MRTIFAVLLMSFSIHAQSVITYGPVGPIDFNIVGNDVEIAGAQSWGSGLIIISNEVGNINFANTPILVGLNTTNICCWIGFDQNGEYNVTMSPPPLSLQGFTFYGQAFQLTPEIKWSNGVSINA